MQLLYIPHYIVDVTDYDDTVLSSTIIVKIVSIAIVWNYSLLLLHELRKLMVAFLVCCRVTQRWCWQLLNAFMLTED